MDEVLARSGIFQGVDPEAAEALAKEMETIEARKGEIVFNEGEPGDSLYIVLSGKLKVGRRAADGRQNLIAVMGPSDMVGELSLFDPGPRTATATAVVDTRLARLRKQALRPWLTNRPEIAEQLLRVLARRLRRTNDALADLIFTDVPGRVAKNLLQMAGRFGTRDGGVLRVTHDLTQEELAQLVGASRETVNKALADFASRGWLRLDGKSRDHPRPRAPGPPRPRLDPTACRSAVAPGHRRDGQRAGLDVIGASTLSASSGAASGSSKQAGLTVCFGARRLKRWRARTERDTAAGAQPATQHRLLEATVDCLVEFGWSGTTTTVIAERAGRLPRRPAAPLPDQGGAGAGRRRAPGRAPGGARSAPRRRALPAQPAPSGVDRVVDLLAAAFTGPLFVAALEVWVAARTDPDLRAALVPLEARSAATCTGSPSSCSAPTRPSRAYGRRCRPRSTCSAGSASPTCSPTTPRAGERLLAAWKRQLVDQL